MVERTVEDRLREQYFGLLPDIRRVAEELETEIRYSLRPISRELRKHERLVISSRIKECESAVDALRRRQEGRTFDPDRPERYVLESLKDLAGVRVSVFPRRRCREADQALQEIFAKWEADHVFDGNGELVAAKYHGYCQASDRVRGEYQVLPLSTALFWDIEHATIYKPTPNLKGVALHPRMQERTDQVMAALKAFEEEFESLIASDALGGI
jgi:ppGpp synthetase/RelA/SpoT-type nucleotidyltranferase